MAEATLERFIEAQEGAYDRALAELRAGEKRSHWMWFVLPQLRGLGRSPTAHRYGIADAAEARAYLAHPLLGERLRDCARATLRHRDKTLREIFGSPDDLKYRSCLTLFEAVSPPGSADRALFAEALEAPLAGEAALAGEAFYVGERCAPTLALLEQEDA